MKRCRTQEPPGHHARVQRVQRLTPHMFRIVLGGPGLAGFAASEYTDHYIKLLFPVDGVTYPEPFDLQRIRSELPRDQWPRMRTYTVRRWNPSVHELSVDMLHHGEDGLAGPWAARARPGDEVRFVGPGGGYAPDPDADWHLLDGDESALPAIAAALERLSHGARAHAFIEVGGPEEEQPLDTARRRSCITPSCRRSSSTVRRAGCSPARSTAPPRRRAPTPRSSGWS